MRWFAARVVFAAFAVLSIVLVVLLVRLSERCERQAARIDTLYGQAKRLEQAARESKQRADSISSRFSELSLHPIPSLYIGRLRDRGLEDPVADLVDDLQHHPEIISKRGLHERRMGFYEIGRIRVLSEKWAYAPFDDGHIGGEAIFEYRVAQDGAISWHEVASRTN